MIRASVRPAVIALDTLILLALLVAIVILDTGGGAWRIGPLRLSMENPWRPLLWALLALAVRLALDRSSLPFGRPGGFFGSFFGWRERVSAAPSAPLPGWREVGLVAAGLAAAIAVVFHQQLASVYLVPDYGDPLFSMWRLGWVAHQIVADPAHLFDANIFHPLRGTLTYSDSMLLPALGGAPLIWAGVPVAAVYLTLFFGAFLLSGLAMYALARALAFSRGAAWIAALIFSLCQYRIEHYSHLELQMAFWMPLTLLAAHRLLATGHPRHAVYLALALAGQWYSSMYYGFFLTIFAGVFVTVLAVSWRPGWRRFAVAAGTLGLGVALVLPLARVYRSTEAARGSRSEEVVTVYSATPLDWLQPNTRSRWYRDVHVVKREGERELFPNVTPILLGAVGAVPPYTAARLALLVSGLVAFDGSLGFNGHWYPVAYEYLDPVKSMRVPARFAILVNLTLAFFAGIGAWRLAARVRSPRGRGALIAVLSGIFVVESLPDIRLVPLWREPPSLYASLGPRSGAVLFEFPIHAHAHYFGENLPFMYFSTWHWTPMVNGYSGFAPQSYHDLAVATAGFPEGTTVDYLRSAGVTHVSLHCAFWYDEPCALTMQRLGDDDRFRLLVSTKWQGKPARLYELTK